MPLKKLRKQKIKKILIYLYGLLFLFLAIGLVSYFSEKVFSRFSDSVYFDFELQEPVIKNPLGLFIILFYIIFLILLVFTGLLSIIIFFHDIWIYFTKNKKNKVAVSIVIIVMIITFLLIYLPIVPCKVKVINSGIVDEESSYNELESVANVILSNRNLFPCELKEINILKAEEEGLYTSILNNS